MSNYQAAGNRDCGQMKCECPVLEKKEENFQIYIFLISSRMISSHGFISSSQFSRPMQNLYFYLNVANVIVL